MSDNRQADIHPHIARVLLDASTVKRRVAELSAQINADYADKDIVLVGVLKGAVIFMADLARGITTPVAFDFMAVSSYGNAMHSQGIVRIIKDLDVSIAGQHVLLVEDIIDTGLTLSYVLEHLRRSQPASLRVCALLEKARAHERHVEPDYIGFTVPDEFVVGYGLDYAQHYRNLPYIGVLQPEVYANAAE